MAEQLAAFKEADESSAHFGSRRDVVLKLLRRHIVTAEGAVSASKDSKREEAVRSLKSLQMIRDSVSLIGKWATKHCMKTGIAQARRDLHALQVFCDQDPAVQIDSPYFWQQIMVIWSSEGGEELAERLQLQKLVKILARVCHAFGAFAPVASGPGPAFGVSRVAFGCIRAAVLCVRALVSGRIRCVEVAFTASR